MDTAEGRSKAATVKIRKASSLRRMARSETWCMEAIVPLERGPRGSNLRQDDAQHTVSARCSYLLQVYICRKLECLREEPETSLTHLQVGGLHILTETLRDICKPVL